jgi:hypothetical protein
MRTFTKRRLRNFALLAIALACLVWWVRVREQHFGSTSFATGYLLLAAIFFLASYNVRKKLTFLPLGSSSTWLQGHIYVGMGTVGMFAVHAGTVWPTGWLDASLAVVYLLTVGSGLAGLYLTRMIPTQLARVGDEIIYEKIPAFRRQVWRQADEAVLESVSASGATTLADFYTSRLYGYFRRSRGWLYHLRPTSTLRRALMREMTDMKRYLSDAELAGCERLFTFLRRKDDLDFHEARQKVLKLWLFVHIGLTYMLILLAVLHGVLAHAFDGGGL